MLRWVVCFAAIAMLIEVVEPATCAAEDEGPSIVSYGLQGFGSGIGLGLASGFLATGHTFERGEWRTLLLGTAIGALTGMGVGITLGAVDASTTPYGFGVGHYMLQDMSYGVTLGVLGGATVGALVWLDDGRAKDVLIGLAAGALIGGGVGLLLGVLDGSLRKRPERPEPEKKLSFNVGFTPGNGGVPWPYPSVRGRF